MIQNSLYKIVERAVDFQLQYSEWPPGKLKAPLSTSCLLLFIVVILLCLAITLMGGLSTNQDSKVVG